MKPGAVPGALAGSRRQTVTSKTPKFDTLAIHGASKRKNPKHALNYPIFMTSTFSFDSIEEAEYTFTNETDNYIYTRGNNPTLRVLEEKIAALEGGSAAVAFASGMAAISTALFSLLTPGDELLSNNVLYGSANNVVNSILPRYHIKSRRVDFTNLQALADAVTEDTKVLFFETPCNPNLAIIDIEAVCNLARQRGIKVVVDNTFATPYLQQPLALGADVVVHSATKYISGHGDVVAGLAVARDKEYVNSLKFDFMCEFGGVMSPFNGWLLLRGLKTLGLRMREHCRNALAVARYLQQHPRVRKVYYPGLPDFPGHDIARRQMRDFGAMISFDLDGSVEESRQVVEKLQLIKLAVSLGDCETLVVHPFAMTHRSYSPEELAAAGLTPSMIRLSIGLEAVEDILADLDQALA
ncbi:MAG: aminotransferase class I/II-fold pyridoxal phosphate-dependent enzyme [Firmicutes bacterium]|nr:aminotransferase class I/II-fold pyridoxal phosphate-dependent enzyme [Bacillota bacterium]